MTDPKDGDGPLDSFEGVWNDAMRDAFTARKSSVSDEPPSILERIEARTGEKTSRVFLPDDLLVDEAQVVDARSSEVTGPGRRVGRYLVLGEIARGGMGVILHGRDVDLGRDVAIKVLQDKYADNAQLVHRFVEEAQVGGQLQHPGVIPVYEIGLDASSRPFFTMKLVRGRTLSAHLSDRRRPSDELGRLLGVFQHICQTVAYAHSRRVVHRDIKPANVMVGAFGEVLLMDWGMAKVLKRGGIGDEEHEAAFDEEDARIATVRSEGHGSASIAGSVLGTPSFMPPEQARGHVALVDERADVFALGGILCQILTGFPPYTRQPGSSVILQAQEASLAPALARLDSCDAESDLVDLARRCLAVDLRDRPRHGGAVEEAVTAHIAGAERRAHDAQVSVASAKVRVREERKARQLVLALAVAVVALLVIGGGAFWWADDRRDAERERNDTQIRAALKDARRHAREASWGAMAESLRRASFLVGKGRTGEDMLEEVKRVRARLSEKQRSEQEAEARTRAATDARDEKLRRDAAIIARIREIRNEPVEDPWSGDMAYAAAFLEYGLDVDALTPADVAERILTETQQVAEALAFALDDWAGRRRLRTGSSTWRPLVEAAQLCDPDPWRFKLRDAVLKDDKDVLMALAAESKTADLKPGGLALLAMSLERAEDSDAAITLLRQATESHPQDYWLHQQLGVFLAGGYRFRPGEGVEREEVSAERLAEAELHTRIALALQPDSPFVTQFLARLLVEQGELADAEAFLVEAAARLPDDPAPGIGRVGLFMTEGDFVAAERELKVLLRTHPLNRTVQGLMRELRDLGGVGLVADPEAELQRLKAELLTSPKRVDLHVELARCLLHVGDLDGAAASARAALAHMPDHGEAAELLGAALVDGGRYDDAVAALEPAKARGDPEPETWHLSDMAARLKKVQEQMEAFVQREERPSDRRERQDLARVCLHHGYFAHAADLFVEFLEDIPQPRGREGRPGEGPGRGRPEGRGPPERGRGEGRGRLGRGEGRGRGRFRGRGRGRRGSRIDSHRGMLREAAAAFVAASLGLGQDAGHHDDAARQVDRQRAFRCLNNTLKSATQYRSMMGPENRGHMLLNLHRWRHDRRFEPVRSKNGLGALADGDRQAWLDKWAEVDTLLVRRP
ncbi:MAG: hypothetical protein CMJ83_16330 [Planctomycetes bacterium]|nr:hypothetical protein [Planctomycetota bacterium]